MRGMNKTGKISAWLLNLSAGLAALSLFSSCSVLGGEQAVNCGLMHAGMEVCRAEEVTDVSEAHTSSWTDGLTSGDIECLTNEQWLNDKIISAYIQLLLQARPEEDEVAVLSSFFIQKLLESGYESTARWNQKIDIFGCDRLLCIINHNKNHWTLMVIDNSQKEMVYYDSMGGKGTAYTSTLKNYLEKESLKRRSIPCNWSGWKFYAKEDLPQQKNGHDCGVFLLQYTRCLLLKEPMTFNQQSMSQIRERIAKELRSGCLFCDQSQVHQSDTQIHSYCSLDGPSSDSECQTEASDSDFDDFDKTKEHFTKAPILSSTESELEDEDATTPKTWNSLSPELQNVLPVNDEFSYLIESCKKLPKLTFCGAPETNFEAHLRVNLDNENEAKEWIDALSKQCKCTYRVTRTYKPALKRVVFKIDLHCQHFRKPLTQKQLSLKKPKAKTLISEVKCKKTQCPSTLSITIQNPPKSKCPKYRDTHKALVKLTFNHNHPIESAHVLGFRPVAEETKQEYIRLFSLGHSASSAHHHYEEEVLQRKGQSSIADSAINPNVQWVHRFFNEWRNQILGAENGKGLFNRLEQEVKAFNEHCNEHSGMAKMQWYSSSKDNDIDDDQPPKPKKQKQVTNPQPFILAICTPLMARVHEHVVQSAELVFCDSTASLDRYNTSLFILSTAHPAGGLPLGVVLSSDEKEETITKGLEMLMEILPCHSFHGSGSPSLIMTDDSSAEKGALKNIWPHAVQLLCTFHFLQRRWTWLFEGINKIQHADRATLLNLVKTLVYAKSEVALQKCFKEFLAHPSVQKYPSFIKHIEMLWPRRQEWALCYRSGLPVRGNNTNNISEAGVRILKEIVFSRVKAFNLVEMFQFVTEKLESYYQCKLLSVAHNRIDRYIQVKFRGLNAGKISREHIKSTSNKDQFLVKSRRDPDSEYQVDMVLGTCTCPGGSDGSPCSHQLAVALHCHRVSLNCIPTLHPSSRRQLAYIALGKEATSDIAFYVSVSQFHDEAQKTDTLGDREDNMEGLPDFSASCWAKIHQGTKDTEEDQCEVDDSFPEPEDDLEPMHLLQELDLVFEDLKSRLEEKDPQLKSGVRKFINRYNKMKQSHSSALMASSFHCFGSLHGGTVTNIQGGGIRRGRRIPVQATASGRRKRGTKGKAPATSGRPTKSVAGKENEKPTLSRYQLPLRREAKGKRRHNLALSISKGTQNAGKW